MKILVAGVGNLFFSDDGFGSEVARRLLAARAGMGVAPLASNATGATPIPPALPDGVDVVDVGIRGMHLAYQVLDGYDALVVVDTTRGDGPPGSLYLLEHDLSAMTDCAASSPGRTFDPHGMEPDAVLELLGALRRGLDQETALERVLVLGCEPAEMGPGMDLSPPVARAVDEAVGTVGRIVARLLENRPFTEVGARS